jgi:SAM-dependent methyltransferase
MEKLENTIRQFYGERLSEFGATHQGVDYPNRARHWASLEQVYKIVENERAPFDLLDFGCGYGEFLFYLRENDPQRLDKLIRYTGIDVSPEMIENAKKLFGTRYEFDVRTSPKQDFDFIIVNGTLNLRLGASEAEWTEHCLQTVADLFNCCRKGVAISLLSSERDKFEPGNRVYYANPSQWFEFIIKKISRNVRMLHDYRVPEFTLHILK